MQILVLNCGSVSVKLGAFEGVSSRELRRVGSAGVEGENDHAVAVGLAIDRLIEAGSRSPDAIGIRVVHGGPGLLEPTRVDALVLAAIRSAAELAPLHNDAALAAIGAARTVFGDPVPIVAVFDTAFYRDLPPQAARYAIPVDTADGYSIRRYGFHGLAHRFMNERCAQLAQTPGRRLKLITLQLGGGCSITATEGGCAIDTSMGFSPLEGLVMATRSGDIDPAVVRFLAGRRQTSAAEVEDWLNHRCGLLGVSGTSADTRELLRLEADGDGRAALALDLFCYRARKYIGAYLAALGGADAIAFGGGIGQNAPEIRARICSDMDWCGLRLDPARNAAARGVEAGISADDASIAAYAVPVDEEVLIARDTAECLAQA